MKKIFTISNEPFCGRPTIVAFGYTGAEVYKKLVRTTQKEKGITKIKEFEKLVSGTGRFYFTDTDFRLVFLPAWDNSTEQMGSLAHELTHCAQSVLHERSADTKDSLGISETLAYLIDFYVRQTLSKLKKK